MQKAFIIMQIGNSDLDRVCEQAIVPALKACGLQPTRVDKHNEGGLLKSEIIGLIEQSEIIVADLTNERPNVYLEIGYTMGVDKFRNLILTSREDHFPESETFEKGGPKIHFDLLGYDILAWSEQALDSFQDELVKRIRRRLAILSPRDTETVGPSDSLWRREHREKARQGLEKSGLPGAMELYFELKSPKPQWRQQELNAAARESTIDTFGWPIGIYLDNQDDYRPKPIPNGIVAEIAIEDRSSYDYWALSRGGDFYSLISYFEDRRKPNYLFLDTSIVRVTEALLYCQRLYSRLDVDPTHFVTVGLRFTGLAGRTLGVANPARLLSNDRRCASEDVESEITASLQEIESNLTRYVKDLLSPLFILFDFFELNDSVYEDLVSKFVRGIV